MPQIDDNDQQQQILARIKAATASAHRSVEKHFKILDPELTIPHFIAWLELLYGFYAPFEAMLQPWSEQLSAIDWQKRLKTPLLKQDLEHLGITSQANLLLCPDLPTLSDYPSVLGAIYVVEGSTMGGRVIAQHLEKNLDLNVNNGASFFLPYGEQFMENWQSFRLYLASAAANPDHEQIIIASAISTFAKLEQWFKDGMS